MADVHFTKIALRSVSVSKSKLMSVEGQAYDRGLLFVIVWVFLTASLSHILLQGCNAFFRYCRLHLLSQTCLLLSIYIILLLVLLLPQVTAVATTTQTKVIEPDNNQIKYRDQINRFRGNYTVREIMHNKRKSVYYWRIKFVDAENCVEKRGASQVFAHGLRCFVHQ